MSQYLIPTDDAFVDIIAKSMAKDSIHRGAMHGIEMITGDVPNELSAHLEQTLDILFEHLWNGTSDSDMRSREKYRQDARSAISAINLVLITAPPDKYI